MATSDFSWTLLFGEPEYESVSDSLRRWLLRQHFFRLLRYREPSALEQILPALYQVYRESVQPLLKASLEASIILDDPLWQFVRWAPELASSRADADDRAADRGIRPLLPALYTTYRNDTTSPQEGGFVPLGTRYPVGRDPENEIRWPEPSTKARVEVYVHHPGQSDTLAVETLAGLSGHSPADVENVLFAIEGPLVDWGRNMRLAEGWIFDLLLGQVSEFFNPPSAPPAWTVSCPRTWRGTSVMFTGLPVPGSWDPSIESRTSAKARLTKAFDRQLDVYLDGVEARIARDSYKKPTGKRVRHRKRQPGPPNRSLHLEWLFRYQVQQWTYGAIAKRYDRTENTVYRACAAMAEEIGLTRRGRHEYRPPLLT